MILIHMMNKQVPQLPFEPKLLKWSLFQNRLNTFGKKAGQMQFHCQSLHMSLVHYSADHFINSATRWPFDETS